jgi:hypothetical protein
MFFCDSGNWSCIYQIPMYAACANVMYKLNNLLFNLSEINGVNNPQFYI